MLNHRLEVMVIYTVEYRQELYTTLLRISIHSFIFLTFDA